MATRNVSVKHSLRSFLEWRPAFGLPCLGQCLNEGIGAAAKMAERLQGRRER
jgi:hypothetical protein